MMLRRSNAYVELWDRKKFRGPLDIRAPEDHLVVEQERTRAEPISSPWVDKALAEFDAAVRSRVESEMKRAAKDVVDATSAHFRMSGVPTFAHDPVPWQLIEHALPIEHLAPGEHTNEVVGRFVDVFDDSVKPLLREQVMKHLGRGGTEEGRSPLKLLQEAIEPEDRNLPMASHPFAMRSLSHAMESLAPAAVFGAGLGLNENEAPRLGRSGEALGRTLLPVADEAIQSGRAWSTLQYSPQDYEAKVKTLEYDPRRDRAQWVEVQQQFDPHEAIQYVPPEQRAEFERRVREGSAATAEFLGRVLYELSPLPQAQEFVDAVRRGDYAMAAIAVLMVLPVFKGVRISHHIIAKSAKHHAELRKMMRNFGIDIEDTDNIARMMKAAHEVLHTNNYYMAVAKRVSRARNPDDMRAALRDIKGLLEGFRDKMNSRHHFPPQRPRR